MLELAIGLVIGLLVGALAAWYVSRSNHMTVLADLKISTGVEVANANARLEQAARDIARLESESRDSSQRLSNANEEIARMREEQARLITTLDKERKAAEEKLMLFQDAENKLREAFKALASDALSSNTQSFLELARASLGEFQKLAVADIENRQKAIDELVKPVRESIRKVEQKLQEVEKERVGAYSSLTTQVRSLAETQAQLQGETANLVKALRTPIVRGRWGEIQLRRVVEMAGMLDHCDFVEQQSVTTEAGRLRPDLLVKLPGGKTVIVDSKAPLAAFLEASESREDAQREAFLRDHARQVRDHMTQLSGKSYWDQFEATPEFVVMFLPGETFFSAALQYDPSLIEFGVGRKVIPASPTTLIALLRAVAYGWRQEKIAENAQAISDLGYELYERIRVWAEHLARVGKGLDGAVHSYNKAVGSFESRVLVTARRFKELGAASTADLPAPDSVNGLAREIHAPELDGIDEDFDSSEPDDETSRG